MALLKCPECGRDVSDKATACPQCGCPVSEMCVTTVEKEEQLEKDVEKLEEKDEPAETESVLESQNDEEVTEVRKEDENKTEIILSDKPVEENTSGSFEGNVKKTKEKVKLSQRTWFVILMLIFVFPVGCFFMWKNKKFKKPIRIVVTVILGWFWWIMFKPCSHEWTEATCTDAKVCNLCGIVEGEALGHSWEEATCTTPKTCAQCGMTEGEALEHSVKDWSVKQEATCTEEGTQVGNCSVCKKEVTESIEKVEHTPGEWEVTVAATSSADGERSKKCTVCGEVTETETYELSAEEKISLYKQECATYSYNEIARNPDSYVGKSAKFTGEVIQVMEDGDDYTMRVNVTQGKYYWDDTILVVYTKQDSSEPRILEDDIITMYGLLAGTHTYESVMGASITIPLYYAEYVEFN